MINESITLSFNKNNLIQIIKKITLSNTLFKIYYYLVFNR